jgi:hypothetical protein
LFDNVEHKLTLDSLVLEAKRAKETLVGVLGSGSNYKDSSYAVKTILAAGSTVEKEMSVLLGCHQLGLSSDSIGSFLVVAVITEASRPLRCFVECCHQFRFVVVVKDPSFTSWILLCKKCFEIQTHRSL